MLFLENLSGKKEEIAEKQKNMKLENRILSKAFVFLLKLDDVYDNSSRSDIKRWTSYKSLGRKSPDFDEIM